LAREIAARDPAVDEHLGDLAYLFVAPPSGHGAVVAVVVGPP